jgi:hypothetical protein
MEEYKSRCNVEKVQRRAEQATNDLRAVFKRACEGMIASAFHARKRARGSGDAQPKELLAIRCTRMLYGHLRQLPTKTEVRLKLIAIGVRYRKDKNENGKWDRLFEMAGLGDLPD